jgi:hypothetical protein
MAQSEKFLFAFLILLQVLLFPVVSFSQGFLISSPKVEFDGKQMRVSYDIITKNKSDEFYIWVVIEKKNGEQLSAKSVSGDIGENVKGGMNKSFVWLPSNDSVFLNEDILIEVKGEKYIKSFNKGSALLMSTIMPGLGQTKISNGKPFWLIGVASYGILAGGIIFHTNSISSYDDYLVEQDPAKRDDLFAKSQQQLNISNVMFVSSAAAWVLNLVWIAATPNRYKPLKHVKVRIDQPGGPLYGTKLVSLQLTF